MTGQVPALGFILMDGEEGKTLAGSLKTERQSRSIISDFNGLFKKLNSVNCFEICACYKVLVPIVFSKRFDRNRICLSITEVFNTIFFHPYIRIARLKVRT